jgi:hypothetical protein
MAQSGWYADPVGRHEKRFYNGLIWTSDVLDSQEHGVDPLPVSAPAVTQRAFTPASVAVTPAPSYGWSPPPSQAWRDGEDLVIKVGTPLPPLCVFCGQPAVAGIRTAINGRGHPLAGLQLAGLRFPVCAEDRLRNRTAMWTPVIGLPVTVLLFYGMFRLTGRLPEPLGPLSQTVLTFGAVRPTVSALLIGTLTFMAFHGVRWLLRTRSGRPRPVWLRIVRSRGGYIWLRNADERYLSQLPSVAAG